MTATTPSPGAALRAAVLQQRRDLVARLAHMPPEMSDRPQWLLWKLVDKPGAVKPAKVPFYVNGQLRGWPHGKPKDGIATAQQPQVDQGAELDRTHLVSLTAALREFERTPAWAGVGFAFLPGDGLIGVDIDGAIDPATGEMSALCAELLVDCASYAETSVSGKGVHIILRGSTDKFKNDRIGLEVYAGSQYFTCTGQPVGERLPVADADPAVMARMRELVDAANAHDKAERDAERERARAAARAAAPPAAPRPAPAPGQARDDFKLVNELALARLDRWVTTVLPGARVWGDGYRITSKALGRDLQEDLQLLPTGIYDFGEEAAMSPIDVVLKWRGMAAPKDALHWLAGAIGVELAPRRLRVVPPSPPPAGEKARPAAPQQGEGDGAPWTADGPPDGYEPPPDDGHVDSGEAPSGGAGKGRKIDPKDWAKVEQMLDRYVLIYGEDTAWDRVKLKLVRIPALRLFWGKTAVGLWLTRDNRAEADPEDLVFEPDQDVQPPRINMWRGLDLQPEPCEAADVDPMLQLLRHLCSETKVLDADGKLVPTAVDDVMHWMLCWCALPLQHPGTKMATALVLHGAQGTGKNLFFDAWRDLYGAYGITVTQTELEDKYNGWTSRKLAAVGDEVVSRAEMYHNKNRLKLIVTQRDKFAIRDLYAAVRWESNHMNVVFLSNESEPLVLEDRDRRYLVVYTPLEAAAELYQRVRDFLADGGLAKWLDYLLTYDVGDFDAHRKPPFTEAKRALIEANWRPAVRFIHEWMEGFLDLPQQVCSVEQLYRAFRHWCDKAGERWPPSRSKFTTEVNRWVSESRVRGPDGRFPPLRLEYKPISLAQAGTARKTQRCFIPLGCQPPEGITEGVWAADCVQSFEHTLYRFMGRRSFGDDKGDDK